MDRVIEALGVDPVAAVREDQGRAFAEACSTCLHCRNSRACQDWLDAADGLPLPPDFCANASFFRQFTLSKRADKAADERQRHPEKG